MFGGWHAQIVFCHAKGACGAFATPFPAKGRPAQSRLQPNASSHLKELPTGRQFCVLKDVSVQEPFLAQGRFLPGAFVCHSSFPTPGPPPAQGNVGCDQLLCNDVNCTDVFTTGADASDAIFWAALTATGTVAERPRCLLSTEAFCFP